MLLVRWARETVAVVWLVRSYHGHVTRVSRIGVFLINRES